MMRSLLILPAWWFVQAAGGANSFAEYGIGIGLMLFVAALWREDRKARIEQQKATDARYTELVGQLKAIIEGNTTALTRVVDSLAGKINNCPLSSDPVMHTWLRAWAEHSLKQQHETDH